MKWMNKSKLLYNGMNTLPDIGRLIIKSTMESLGLDNYKRKERMNGYFTHTANCDVIQPPEKGRGE